MNVGAVKISIVVALCLAIFGCAGAFSSYGRLVPNEQVGRDLESGSPPSGYSYYYSGPDDAPNAILGIADGYTLDTHTWKPVDLTPAKMASWMQWITRGYGTSIRYRGADVTDNQGKRIGIWYSPAWNTVVRVEGNTVVVNIPNINTFDDNRKEPFSILNDPSFFKPLAAPSWQRSSKSL
ncbi:MAG: hypothetical protein AB1921_02940 [Thermodesulfobacteriota bacterium]